MHSLAFARQARLHRVAYLAADDSSTEGARAQDRVQDLATVHADSILNLCAPKNPTYRRVRITFHVSSVWDLLLAM